MRKLIAALATATILTVGSIGWKAEAAIVTGVDSLPPLIKTYGSYRDPYYRPYRDPYCRPYRHGYGYNDYGYWPYGNYPVSPLEVPPDPDGNCGWPCGGDQE